MYPKTTLTPSGQPSKPLSRRIDLAFPQVMQDKPEQQIIRINFFLQEKTQQTRKEVDISNPPSELIVKSYVL